MVRPDHVPEDLVFDVDFHNLPGMEDGVHAAWKALQTSHPRIFWTPRNGGHWMVTRAPEVKTVQRDWERFSTKGLLLNIQRPFPAPPIDLDPPEHGAWRRIIGPAFSPAVVRTVEARIRNVCDELIDQIVPRGECNFVSEFASVLPIEVFLTMVGLPASDRMRLMPAADRVGTSTDPAEIWDARLELQAYIEEQIDSRQSDPRDDLIQRIADAHINGEKISRTNAVGIATLLLTAGLDTVRNMMGYIALFLARNPEHQEELRANPQLIPIAVEELIRAHGIPNSGRLVTVDTQLAGVQLRQGDLILGANALFGLDDDTVPDPMHVDFHRPAPIPHAAFGEGPHFCPGSVLARSEIRIWLEIWLERVPPFRVKEGVVPQQGSASVNFVKNLWLCW